MVHETYVKEAEGFSRRRFIASEGGLKVDLPSDPTELKTTLRTGVGPVKVHGFRSKHDGVVYLAAYSECHARLDMLEYVKLPRRAARPLDPRRGTTEIARRASPDRAGTRGTA